VEPAARTRTHNQPQRPQRAQSRTGECCPDWLFPSASSALSAVKPALSRALRRPRAMRGTGGKNKNAESTAEAAESAEENRGALSSLMPPSASSALSAVKFALSRALRRPGAMRGPCGKNKNANQPQRPQRAQRRTGERRPDWVFPSASSAPSAVKNALSRALRRPGTMPGVNLGVR
jgi:hypothetical protein